MRTLSPNVDPTFNMKDFVSNRKESRISESIAEKIKDILTAFEFHPNMVEDFSKNILDSDVDTALEDSVPLYTFFGLYANKAETKEKYYEEALKTIEKAGVKDPTKSVTSQKGGVRTSELYRKTQAAYLRWFKIRKDCQIMANAMEKRLEATRTRSVDRRMPLNGPWTTKEQ